MSAIYANSSNNIFNEYSPALTYRTSDDPSLRPIAYSNIENELQIYEQIRNNIIRQYEKSIVTIISQDEFLDGEISNAALFIQEACQNGQIEYVRAAIMNIFLSQIRDSHILEGILVMISSIPFDAAQPQGPVIALAMLQHEKLEFRDRAIQCYEKWNSKQGLDALKSLNCHPKWLQRYVEKVIMYIERDGID